tara:strand:- start:3464 stop:4474 length:1011 start_codon:yes stop_codon:yes gene_type:complete
MRKNKNNFMSVSIIVPTYNRSNRLEKALLSLNKLDYPKEKYEVIVVNDGSKDNTEEIVKLVSKSIDYKLKYLYQENKRLSAARNLAIENASNEIIVSVDDDMLFPKDWLKTLIEPLKNNQVGAVGGPSIAPPFASLFQRSVDHCMTTSFVGTGGMIGTTKKSFVKYWPRGGNMAIPKKVFDEVGLFDEKFIPSEEIDLDRRIEKAGYKLGLVRKAFVWHMPRTNLKGFLKQIYRRGIMKIQFLKRYKSSFEFFYLLPMLGSLGLILLILFSFFNKIFLYVLLGALVLYGLILFIDSLIALRKIRKLRVLFLIPFLLFLQHFVYGLGTFRALFKRAE